MGRERRRVGFIDRMTWRLSAMIRRRHGPGSSRSPRSFMRCSPAVRAHSSAPDVGHDRRVELSAKPRRVGWLHEGPTSVARDWTVGRSSAWPGVPRCARERRGRPDGAPKRPHSRRIDGPPEGMADPTVPPEQAVAVDCRQAKPPFPLDGRRVPALPPASDIRPGHQGRPHLHHQAGTGQGHECAAQDPAGSSPVSRASLQADLANAQARNTRLTARIQQLEKRLSQALGTHLTRP